MQVIENLPVIITFSSGDNTESVNVMYLISNVPSP